MDIVKLFCPNSPIWEGYPFSECFNDLVFGFGGNVITVILIAIVGFMQRDREQRIKRFWSEKFVSVVTAFGACVSFIHVVFLLWEICNGHKILYHDLMYRCSQLLVWTAVLLLSWCGRWSSFCCNRVLCLWWIVKPLLQVPYLQIVLFSSEVLWCFEESTVFLLDVALGISINIIRMRLNSPNRIDNQLEDPLLVQDLEDVHSRVSETGLPIWTHMTFNNIKPIMDKGVMKQLDFGDLLTLPNDMDPSSCHNVLLTSWRAQQIDKGYNPSFFKAICSAYGWPYMRLGLLKVFNDCLGFAGPLLLNRLIQFLQQGSGGVDGYVLAASLGLTSVLKSLLDTQYTYRLAVLKLKLRAGIMTVIYQKCLSISLSERTKFSEGEIQTYMSVDADRTVNLANSFHDMWR